MTRLAEKPFALIGVNGIGRPAKDLKAVMEKEKLNWRSFADQNATFQKWSAGTPAYYAIDRKGMIRYKWVGNPGEKTIDGAIEKLLAEAP